MQVRSSRKPCPPLAGFSVKCAVRDFQQRNYPFVSNMLLLRKYLLLRCLGSNVGVYGTDIAEVFRARGVNSKRAEGALLLCRDWSLLPGFSPQVREGGHRALTGLCQVTDKHGAPARPHVNQGHVSYDQDFPLILN